MKSKSNLRRRTLLSTAAGALCLTLVLALACATNPVTRQSQLMLVSEDQEIKIGREGAKEIREQYGYYKALPGLQDYVKTVGNRLVAQCQRRDIVYHFHVADSPTINAFALPGGYIYVTRGILARMNSEDELAAVLGHELTHVAARHGAAQLSKAYAAQFGVAAISIASPEVGRSFGGLVDASLQLAFLGYSRTLEHQADEYGITYMEKAGYTPRGTVKMFRMFQTLESRDPSRLERFLLSHPPTAERLAYARRRLRELEGSNPKQADQPLKRKIFVTRIKGLLLGQSRGDKVMVGQTFYDKAHRASFTLPAAYAADLNPKEGVAVFTRMAKGGTGGRTTGFVVGFEVNDLNRRQSAGEYIRRYLGKIKGTVTLRKATTMTTKGGVKLRVRIVDLATQSGTLRAMLGFHVGSESASVLYGYTEQSAFGGAKGEFGAILSSLRFPSQRELSSVRPPTLDVVAAKEGDSWGKLCRRYYERGDLGSSLALYNGIFNPKRAPSPGMLVKIPDVHSLAKAEG